MLSHSHGFSLIEVLVYLALLVVIAVIVVETFLSLRNVFAQARAHHLVTAAAEASLERMVFEIEDAAEVVVLDSVFGSHPGSLTVSNDGVTRAFYINSGQLRVKENGVDAGPLTPSAVTVENLIFTRYVNAHTEAVRISLTLHVEGEPVSLTKSFRTMSVLRNAYE